MRGGQLIGALWGATSGKAAGYKRTLAADSDNLICPEFWYDRLTLNYRQGHTPVQAIRSRIGVPEDPTVRRYTRRRRRIRSLYSPRALGSDQPRRTTPGRRSLATGRRAARRKSLGPFTRLEHSILGRAPTYAQHTDTTVHYYPITLNETVVGYLWASPVDQAAQYLPRAAAGRQGTIATVLWQLRLSNAYAAGFLALEAIRHCRNHPYDFLSGDIGPNTPAFVAPALAELQ